MMIKYTRYDNKSNWLDIGRAIFSITNGKGINIWEKYTENSREFKTNECKAYWYKFRNNNLSVKTLAWYAKIDSCDRYRDWHNAWCHGAMEKSLEATDFDVANAFYRKYWLDYIFIPLKGINTWYQFTDRWESVDAARLRTRISTKFCRELEKMRTKLMMDSACLSLMSNTGNS